MKIPQMFYLRKCKVRVRYAPGKFAYKTFHMFWNYRGTINGTVSTTNRNTAKVLIMDKYPEAEFWR